MKRSEKIVLIVGLVAVVALVTTAFLVWFFKIRKPAGGATMNFVDGAWKGTFSYVNSTGIGGTLFDIQNGVGGFPIIELKSPSGSGAVWSASGSNVPAVGDAVGMTTLYPDTTNPNQTIPASFSTLTLATASCPNSPCGRVTFT